MFSRCVSIASAFVATVTVLLGSPHAVGETTEEAMARLLNGWRRFGSNAMPLTYSRAVEKPDWAGLEIQNRRPGEELRVYLSGRTTLTVVVAPGQTRRVELPFGQYKVYAEGARQSLRGHHWFIEGEPYWMVYSGQGDFGLEVFGRQAWVKQFMDGMMLDADKATLFAAMGQPSRAEAVPIGGTRDPTDPERRPYRWDYLLYKERGAFYEAIGDRIHTVTLGHGSSVKVLGIGIGDDEAWVREVLQFASKSVERWPAIVGLVLPLELRAEPAVEAPALLRYAPDSARINCSFQATSDDGAWVKLRCNRGSESGQGWVPADHTRGVRSRYSDYEHGCCSDAPDDRVFGVTYRTRSGKVTQITVQARKVRYRHVAGVEMMSIGLGGNWHDAFEVEQYEPR